jgi:hypothetical protein
MTTTYKVDTVPDNLMMYYPSDSRFITKNIFKNKIANIATGTPDYNADMTYVEFTPIDKAKVGDGSFAFNGRNSVIQLPRISLYPNTMQGITISFFFKLTKVQKPNSCLFEFSNSAKNEYISLDTMGNFKIVTATSDKDTTYKIPGFDKYENVNKDKYLDDSWHHILLSINFKENNTTNTCPNKLSTTWLIYIDNILINYYDCGNSFSRFPNVTNYTINLDSNYIGKSNINNSFIIGQISDFRLYKIAIVNPSDILKLYNCSSVCSEKVVADVTIAPQTTKPIVKPIIIQDVLYTNPFEGFDIQNKNKWQHHIKIMNISIGLFFSVGYFYLLFSKMRK